MRIATVSEEKSFGMGRDEPSEPVLLVSRRREPRVLREDYVYSWLEDYLVRLDGKEARDECYAWLEQWPCSSVRLGKSYNGSRVGVWRGFWTCEVLKSVTVGLLLFAVVASTITGSEAVFFSTLLFAWLLFPVLVGLRKTLDAGCAFMLISVGIMLVVGLAQNGPGYLLP